MRYTVKPVIYDEDMRYYRDASKAEAKHLPCEWAVYEDGNFADTYPTEKEARDCVKDMRA